MVTGILTWGTTLALCLAASWLCFWWHFLSWCHPVLQNFHHFESYPKFFQWIPFPLKLASLFLLFATKTQRVWPVNILISQIYETLIPLKIKFDFYLLLKNISQFFWKTEIKRVKFSRFWEIFLPKHHQKLIPDNYRSDSISLCISIKWWPIQIQILFS